MSQYKMPNREQNSNKGSFGKVLNISGCDNYIGAAYLSSISAYKVGAGLIALSSTDKVIDSVSKFLPEAVYLTRKEGLMHANKYGVFLIGCGLGLSRAAKKDFKNFVSEARKNNIPTIIDADGLNIIAQLEKIELPQNTIITPHPMEAARLLHIDLKYLLENLDKCALDLCEKYGCITVLKTHRTIIRSDIESFVNNHGNSSLAKAGTGDVLAGIIAGLVAQKMTTFEAAKLGVYLHSRAGEIASYKLTEYSVLASDLINFIPDTIKEIL